VGDAVVNEDDQRQCQGKPRLDAAATLAWQLADLCLLPGKHLDQSDAGRFGAPRAIARAGRLRIPRKLNCE
jgi:hypothetical protein